jgi:predicted enzyme related to lactoylglutathione lyase
MTAHAAGTFCWPELGTTDQAAALKFYTDLFGWTVTEMPIPGGVYSMIKKGKDDVGAAYTLMDEMVKQGVPPNWMSYVATDDIDAACERVKKNGGQVVVGPMDVKPDGNHLIGRMAACMDPEGAAFSLWQAGSHIGTTLTGEPGSLCWNELWSRNPDAAYKFYAAVFGWGSSPMDMGGMTYQMMMVGEQPGGGIMPMPADMQAPAHWLTYFAVDDADRVVAKAKASGAKVFMGPDDIPNIGRMAILSDPQGATFAVIKLAQQ